LMAWITAGRSALFRRCNSSLSFSAPRAVMGMGMTENLGLKAGIRLGKNNAPTKAEAQ
jgi:hypothetical protein